MKIIAIGRNYINHVKELGNPIPSQPIVFMKPTNAVMKNNHAFYYPNFSNNINYEGEIVLKVCKNGRYINKKYAMEYIDEVTFGIDFTARDLQKKCKEKGLPWEIAKAFDRSAPIGKFIPIKEIPNIHDLFFSLKKNGKIVQQASTKELIFSMNELISYVTQFFTLNKGDLIFTGTPSGVGSIKKGDVLEGFIEDEHLLTTKIK
jgi:2-keto-4-pentenoate hydratase/2-oxohepta-3-ene-1,7-dioic acid hydratase in catechol pathway